MRYWWVNHNLTFRHEIDGGYLWSPITEASGARSRFYENMREASPGDIVLSYARGRVEKIGLVADFAITAPKPAAFGSTRAYWKDTGWLLPIEWQAAPVSISPKAIIGELSPFLPRSHSPFRADTGGGNQKAYLAEVSRDLVRTALASGGLHINDYEEATPSLTIEDFRTRAEDALEHEIRNDLTMDQTVREHVAFARRGQGVFRGRVLHNEPVCRVTGVTNANLLLASHVKPWRACQTAEERLDGYNGLMLTPHADFLFDRGLLSFSDDGRTVFSPKLSEADGNKLGLFTSQRPLARPLHDRSLQYFDHHRRHIFLS